ncbi:hypothetical protein B0H13DRAFT_1877518, partial [Mycena leptocephala]
MYEWPVVVFGVSGNKVGDIIVVGVSGNQPGEILVFDEMEPGAGVDWTLANNCMTDPILTYTSNMRHSELSEMATWQVRMGGELMHRIIALMVGANLRFFGIFAYALAPAKGMSGVPKSSKTHLVQTRNFTPSFPMDAWWPIVQEPRRGRSSNRVTFTREAPGPPIRSDISYAFADSLSHQNLLTMGREDADAVYGEVSVHNSSANSAYLRLQPDCARADQEAAQAKQEAELLESRIKAARTKATVSTRSVARKKLAAKAAAAARKQVERLPRRSRRNRQGRPGDSSNHGVYQLGSLVRSSYRVHKLIDGCCAPQDVYAWWMSMVKKADTDLRRLYRNGNFAHLGETESRVRFGIDFGYDWA